MLVREQTTQIQMALVTQPLNVVPEVDQMLVHVLVDMEFAVHVSFLKIFTKKLLFFKKRMFFAFQLNMDAAEPHLKIAAIFSPQEQ